jgi:DNA oxidative demethylase
MAMATTQLDLFGATAPIISGLGFAEDIISRDEERQLIAAIEEIDLPPFAFQQWTSKRRTRSFGFNYDFRNAGFAPTEPIPEFLLPLRERAAGFAGLAPADLVQALIIRYDPGAGIGWHKDRPELDAVIGISLGAPATMRFRRTVADRVVRATKPLPPRSIYHLDGEVRHEWEHSIPAGTGTRWSVTFRGLSPKGRERLGRGMT